MNREGKKCVLYPRVSTEMQVDGYSLEGQKTDYNDLDRYEAEVRAFRAKYYYYLVDLFGRVPLIVSSSIPVKDVRQSDRKEGFDFVVKELQESLLLLSTAHSNSPGDYYG